MTLYINSIKTQLSNSDRAKNSDILKNTSKSLMEQTKQKAGSKKVTKTMLDYNSIESALDRIEPYVHRTPIVTCSSINKLAGVEVVLKCENLQKTGAFKARGATNAVKKGLDYNRS